MDKVTLPICEMHIDQRLNKFCKNNDCWIKMCGQCAIELHKGHRIVDYSTLTHEAMSVKENLIQVKKGDLMSLKRIMNNVAELQSQLKEARERYKEDRRISELHIISRIENVAKEEESKFKELDTMIMRFHKRIKEIHNVQAQELEKIPELANAVVTEGTIDDLKTFFEMCQQGIESNTEILEYKKRADTLREDVEDFVMQNPFQFAFNFNKSLFEELKIDKTSVRLTDLLGHPTDKTLTDSKRSEHSASRGDLSKKQDEKLKGREVKSTMNRKGGRDMSKSKNGLLNYKIVRKSSEQACLHKSAPIRNLSASRKPLNSKYTRNNIRTPKTKHQGLKDLKNEVVVMKAELRTIVDIMKEKIKSLSSVENITKTIQNKLDNNSFIEGCKRHLLSFAERVLSNTHKTKTFERERFSIAV
jgi:hypothetical protein